MKKIIENYTSRILDIWKKIVEIPILHICLNFLIFNKNIVLIYFKVIWNCAYFESLVLSQ